MRVTYKIINKTGTKVLLLFLIALLPRIIGIGQHSIFVDEISWLSRAKDVYGTVRTLQWHPANSKWWLDSASAEPIGLPTTFIGGLSMALLSPGYTNYSLNIANDFVAARISNAVLGALFVSVFYFLSRKFVGEKIALVSALLLSIDPIAVGLSRLFQQDMALMAFSSISILAFLYSKNNSSIIISAVFTGLAILTKPQGFLLVPAIMVSSRRRFRDFFVWLVLTAFIVILLFPHLWTNPIKNMIDYLYLQASIVENGNLTFFNGYVTQSPPWYYYFFIFPFRIPLIVLLGFVAGIIVIITNLKKILFQNNYFLVSVVYCFMCVLLISLSDKKLGIRYLFPIWPFIFLVAGYGLTIIGTKLKSWLKYTFWIIVFSFPVFGIIKYYPSHYLYHNNLISPARFQNLEAVGYCDSVKPAIEYLQPRLYHGVKIMLRGCDAAINYYTGYTIDRIVSVAAKPDYIIEETIEAQKNPEVSLEIQRSGYKEITQIEFRGLILAKIYQRP